MSTIAISGATGQVGSALATALIRRGHDVWGLSRHPEKLSSDSGVVPRPADLDDPALFTAAIRGADAVFLLAAGSDPGALVRAAADAGVRQVVLLSSQGAGTRPGMYRLAADSETAVRAGALDWTILRPSGFASNSFGWIPAIHERRTVFAPFGDVALPVIDPTDIADVAAEILDAPTAHVGATYELTGPQAISPREQAAAISTAIQVELSFVELDRESALRAMRGVMPAAVAHATLEILGTPTDAERTPAHDIPKLLGRDATSFTTWAQRNAPAFTRAIAADRPV